MGLASAVDPASGLAPVELAQCVERALALPEIIEVRPKLEPEFPVYSSLETDGFERVLAGVADAIVFAPDGKPQVVVDWKSDVNPDVKTVDHYRSQVRTYLEMTDADRGLIVMVTSGTVIPVERTAIASREFVGSQS